MGRSKVNLYSPSQSARQEERISSALKLLELEGMRTIYEKAVDRIYKQDENATFYDIFECLLEKELLSEKNIVSKGGFSKRDFHGGRH